MVLTTYILTIDRLNGSIGGAVPNSFHPAYHSTFSPLFFDGNRTIYKKALADLSEKGFNNARVFVDPGGWGRSDGINGDSKAALSDAYVSNVADFVSCVQTALSFFLL